MILKHKTVFITGSSRGIGKAIAIAFAKEGANIVLNARQHIPETLVEFIQSLNVKVTCLIGDISDYQTAKNMIQTIKKEFGTLDVLINNAGITKDQLLLRMTEDDFDSVYHINLKGSFNTIKHAVPILLKQKSGTIINISSVVGQTGNVGQVNYAASKAGLIGLTKSVAKEVAPRGITCNAIAPGYIDTDMTEQLSDSVKQSMCDTIPLKRVGHVDDIAQAAIYLAKAQYVTGQVLSVNGGLYM